MADTRDMSAATVTTAPDYIARDTYQGRWQVTRPASNVHGWLPAAELAEMHADGAPFIIWEFSGHTRGGAKLYTRSRFVAAADGRLHGYTSTGSKIIIHPADRVVRYLAK